MKILQIIKIEKNKAYQDENARPNYVACEKIIKNLINYLKTGNISSLNEFKRQKETLINIVILCIESSDKLKGKYGAKAEKFTKEVDKINNVTNLVNLLMTVFSDIADDERAYTTSNIKKAVNSASSEFDTESSSSKSGSEGKITAKPTEQQARKTKKRPLPELPPRKNRPEKKESEGIKQEEIKSEPAQKPAQKPAQEPAQEPAQTQEPAQEPEQKREILISNSAKEALEQRRINSRYDSDDDDDDDDDNNEFDSSDDDSDDPFKTVKTIDNLKNNSDEIFKSDNIDSLITYLENRNMDNVESLKKDIQSIGIRPHEYYQIVKSIIENKLPKEVTVKTVLDNSKTLGIHYNKYCKEVYGKLKALGISAEDIVKNAINLGYRTSIDFINTIYEISFPKKFNNINEKLELLKICVKDYGIKKVDHINLFINAIANPTSYDFENVNKLKEACNPYKGKGEGLSNFLKSKYKSKLMRNKDNFENQLQEKLVRKKLMTAAKEMENAADKKAIAATAAEELLTEKRKLIVAQELEKIAENTPDEKIAVKLRTAATSVRNVTDEKSKEKAILNAIETLKVLVKAAEEEKARKAEEARKAEDDDAPVIIDSTNGWK